MTKYLEITEVPSQEFMDYLALKYGALGINHMYRVNVDTKSEVGTILITNYEIGMYLEILRGPLKEMLEEGILREIEIEIENMIVKKM